MWRPNYQLVVISCIHQSMKENRLKESQEARKCSCAGTALSINTDLRTFQAVTSSVAGVANTFLHPSAAPAGRRGKVALGPQQLGHERLSICSNRSFWKSYRYFESPETTLQHQFPLSVAYPSRYWNGLATSYQNFPDGGSNQMSLSLAVDIILTTGAWEAPMKSYHMSSQILHQWMFGLRYHDSLSL